MPRPALLVLMLALACRGSRDENNEPALPTSPARPVASPLPVLLRGHIGVINASQALDVPSLRDGIIVGIAVDVGDSVEAGAALAKLDEQALQEELRVARAKAQAASAGVDAARVVMKKAEALADRHSKLGNDVLSSHEIEAARSDAKEAEALYQAATATLSAERALIAQLDSMLLQTTIVAPFAGEIAIRYVGLGQSMSRGQPVVRLIAAEQLLVDFLVPPEDKGQYALNDAISIRIEGQDKPLRGIVRRIAPDLDSVAQMIAIEAKIVLDDASRDESRVGTAVWVTPAPKSAISQDE